MLVKNPLLSNDDVAGCREERTNGNAQAVGGDEVLAGVAAGELLAVAALGLAGLGVDVDVGVLVGGTALGSGEGDGGHGGDEEGLDEGHFDGLGWLVGKGWEASVVDWIGLLDDGEKFGLRRWRTRYLYAFLLFRLWSVSGLSPESETCLLVLWILLLHAALVILH